MKTRIKGFEVECSVDEFRELIKKGGENWGTVIADLAGVIKTPIKRKVGRPKGPGKLTYADKIKKASDLMKSEKITFSAAFYKVFNKQASGKDYTAYNRIRKKRKT